MSGADIFFLLFSVLGGLALFIFGMNVMTDGLRQTAGASLRSILSKATGNRFLGIGLGTILGTLVHSSATTVMLVGFVNAGLMTLAESIPPMLGANLGTSISMQLISFKLTDYCLFAITLGFIMEMAAPHAKAKKIGRAIMGFGILFLGMRTMSEAIRPHRELFAKLLVSINGETTANMLFGLLVSTLITGVVQSSGAIIGMCFALITAGVFTELRQVFPIVLGAHIGTCCTAMLGSLGTNIEARRTAISHLAFNILNSLAAIALAPVYLRIIPLTSSDLVRQTANTHSLVMLVGCVAVLPIAPLFARFVRFIVPSRKVVPQPSFLDKKLLPAPEQAIYATIQELQRVARLCSCSLRMTFEIIFEEKRPTVQQIKLNEQVVDEIKLAMKDYIQALTRRALSRRQAILIQNVNRCMIDIERIGDHIDELCDITICRHRNPVGRFSRENLELLMSLHEAAAHVLKLVIDSLNPDQADFQTAAQGILAARDAYVEKSVAVKAAYMEQVANHTVPAAVGVYMSEYVNALDRIVRHSKMIALVEKNPFFWIKRKKLPRLAEEAPEYRLPEKVDPHDFLDRLQNENYV